LDKIKVNSNVKTESKLDLGQKRNLLVQHAKNPYIVHFDDDDYYAPIYIEKMIEYLGRYDFFKLSSWFGYGVKQNFFGYWHTNEVGGFNYNICPNTEYNIFPGFAQKQLDSFIWGYGFCYVFKKEIYPTVKCAAMNHGVDYDFILKLRKEGFTMKELPDKIGLCMHIVHATNTSRMFPNYRIPEFLIPAIFGEDILNYGYFKPFLF